MNKLKVRNIGKFAWTIEDDEEFYKCVLKKEWSQDIQVKFYNMVNTTIRVKFGYYDEFIKMDMELFAYEKIIKYAFNFVRVRLVLKNDENEIVLTYKTKEEYDNATDYKLLLDKDYKIVKKQYFKPFNYLYTIIYSGANHILRKKNYKYILQNGVTFKPFPDEK